MDDLKDLVPIMNRTDAFKTGSIGQDFKHTHYHKYNKGADKIFSGQKSF